MVAAWYEEGRGEEGRGEERREGERRGERRGEGDKDKRPELTRFKGRDRERSSFSQTIE